MTQDARDLLSMIQLFTGIPSLFMPVILAALAKDWLAAVGTAILLVFSLAALTASNASMLDLAIVFIAWLAAMMLGVAVYVRAKP